MAADPGSVLKKCDHSTEKNLFVSVPNRFSMFTIFEYYHGNVDYSVHNVSVATETKKPGTNETDTFEIQASLTVADLMSKFEIKNLVFSCTRKEQAAIEDVTDSDVTTNKEINAFERLMAPKREFPPRKLSR